MKFKTKYNPDELLSFMPTTSNVLSQKTGWSRSLIHRQLQGLVSAHKVHRVRLLKHYHGGQQFEYHVGPDPTIKAYIHTYYNGPPKTLFYGRPPWQPQINLDSLIA